MPITKTVQTPSAELADTFSAADAHFGHVPNFVKVLASNPTFCKSLTAFMIQALSEGRVNWAFKELVILKTLRSVGAYYSYGAHERLALELGVSAEKIGDSHNAIWQTSPHYSKAERAVFALVEQIAVDANEVEDNIWEPLYAHWDHGQLLELTSIITTFINIGRMGDTLGVSDPVLFNRPVV